MTYIMCTTKGMIITNKVCLLKSIIGYSILFHVALYSGKYGVGVRYIYHTLYQLSNIINLI
jgi:hypothetical protein